MFLSKGEQFCKWTLFGILLLSIIAPVPIIIATDLINTLYIFDAILFFLLIAAGIQGVVGMVGWVMLCRDNETGKKLLIGTYLTTLAGYGIYSFCLWISILVPGPFIVYPIECFSIFTLFHISAAVLQLQHFWTRYIL